MDASTRSGCYGLGVGLSVGGFVVAVASVLTGEWRGGATAFLWAVILLGVVIAAAPAWSSLIERWADRLFDRLAKRREVSRGR